MTTKKSDASGPVRVDTVTLCFALSRRLLLLDMIIDKGRSITGDDSLMRSDFPRRGTDENDEVTAMALNTVTIRTKHAICLERAGGLVIFF
jgi:hypothetical protein